MGSNIEKLKKLVVAKSEVITAMQKKFDAIKLQLHEQKKIQKQLIKEIEKLESK